MNTGKQLLVAAVVLAAVAVFALGFFVALGVRSVVAGPDSAPAASAPNPGHSWSEIGDLPGTIWHSNNDGPDSGLDADTLDGLQPGPGGGLSAGTLSRSGFGKATVDSTGTVGRSASVTVGADGLPVISYYRFDTFDLKVAHCGNADCSDGNVATTVDAADNVGDDVSLTVGSDGLPLISYYDGTNGDLKIAHCDNAACTASTTTTADSGGDVGRHTSVTVGADGLPLVSYFDATNGHLKVAHCDNVACTSATITTVDDDNDVGQWTSVAVGADSLPVISYYAGSTKRGLKVAHCENAACTSATMTNVDDAPDVGWYTSVTVGVDGLPLISYFDNSNGDLKVAHCGNAACSGGASTITTIDSSGGVGLSTSVAVGADGLPLISYFDDTNDDLKVAHCGRVDCSADNSITTVDSQGTVGSPTSVTVGTDGLPIIGYYDETNGDLKVAHCSNRFCVPYHRPR